MRQSVITDEAGGMRLLLMYDETKGSELELVETRQFSQSQKHFDGIVGSERTQHAHVTV